MIKYSGPIIVIAGPTASGKSSIVLKLAKEIDVEIINADSRQIYKELQIGTARPTEEEMQNIPHHLYGHVSVKEQYNIYKYQRDVQEILNNLSKGKVPILVGGTGLYIDSIVFNYALTPNTDESQRDDLEQKSVEELQEIAGEENINQLNESDRYNPARLIRIIEKGNVEHRKGSPLNHKYFVLDIPKEILKEKIEKRTEEMLHNGLIEEKKNIREKGLNNYKALKSIGYQEFDGYFEGQKDIGDVKKDINTHTYRYAKRQRTWFRRNKDAIFTQDYDLILEEVLKFINS